MSYFAVQISLACSNNSKQGPKDFSQSNELQGRSLKEDFKERIRQRLTIEFNGEISSYSGKQEDGNSLPSLSKQMV